MKNTFLFALAITAAAFCSCGSSDANNSDTDSTSMGTDMSTVDSGNSLNTMNTADTTGPVSDMDKQFMSEAAAGGTTEVLASQIAIDRSNNDRVKSFANMMISDHTKANDELKSLAAQKNVTLPDSVMEKQHTELNKLRTTPAKSFDAAYMKMMNADHKETIDKFQMASEKCDNSAVRSFASKTLPALKMHEDSVMAVQKSL